LPYNESYYASTHYDEGLQALLMFGIGMCFAVPLSFWAAWCQEQSGKRLENELHDAGIINKHYVFRQREPLVSQELGTQSQKLPQLERQCVCPTCQCVRAPKEPMHAD